MTHAQVGPARTKLGSAVPAMAWTCTVVAFLGLGATPPGPGEKGPDARRYDDQVRPFLARHCLACHGAEKPKGDLRLDTLSPDFNDPASRERWLAVLKRVKAGEMPPK